MGRHRLPEVGVVVPRQRATYLVLLLTGRQVGNPTRHDGSQTKRGTA